MPVVGFVGGSHCRAGHAEAMMEAGCAQVFDRMAEVAQFLGVRLPQSDDADTGRRSR
jgi:hypothetical protein